MGGLGSLLSGFILFYFLFLRCFSCIHPMYLGVPYAFFNKICLITYQKYIKALA